MLQSDANISSPRVFWQFHRGANKKFYARIPVNVPSSQVWLSRCGCAVNIGCLRASSQILMSGTRLHKQPWWDKSLWIKKVSFKWWGPQIKNEPSSDFCGSMYISDVSLVIHMWARMRLTRCISSLDTNNWEDAADSDGCTKRNQTEHGENKQD